LAAWGSLLIPTEDEVEAPLTLRRFALQARISLGDNTEVSSKEVCSSGFGLFSEDKDISMRLKIEESGIGECVTVDSIPASSEFPYASAMGCFKHLGNGLVITLRWVFLGNRSVGRLLRRLKVPPILRSSGL